MPKIVLSEIGQGARDVFIDGIEIVEFHLGGQISKSFKSHV